VTLRSPLINQSVHWIGVRKGPAGSFNDLAVEQIRMQFSPASIQSIKSISQHALTLYR